MWPNFKVIGTASILQRLIRAISQLNNAKKDTQAVCQTMSLIRRVQQVLLAAYGRIDFISYKKTYLLQQNLKQRSLVILISCIESRQMFRCCQTCSKRDKKQPKAEKWKKIVQRLQCNILNKQDKALRQIKQWQRFEIKQLLIFPYQFEESEITKEYVKKWIKSRLYNLYCEQLADQQLFIALEKTEGIHINQCPQSGLCRNLAYQGTSQPCRGSQRYGMTFATSKTAYSGEKLLANLEEYSRELQNNGEVSTLYFYTNLDYQLNIMKSIKQNKDFFDLLINERTKEAQFK